MLLLNPQLFSSSPLVSTAAATFAGAQRNKHAITPPPRPPQGLPPPLLLPDILSTAVTVDSSLNRGGKEKNLQLLYMFSNPLSLQGKREDREEWTDEK